MLTFNDTARFSDMTFNTILRCEWPKKNLWGSAEERTTLLSESLVPMDRNYGAFRWRFFALATVECQHCTCPGAHPHSAREHAEGCTTIFDGVHPRGATPWCTSIAIPFLFRFRHRFDLRRRDHNAFARMGVTCSLRHVGPSLQTGTCAFIGSIAERVLPMCVQPFVSLLEFQPEIGLRECTTTTSRESASDSNDPDDTAMPVTAGSQRRHNRPSAQQLARLRNQADTAFLSMSHLPAARTVGLTPKVVPRVCSVRSIKGLHCTTGLHLCDGCSGGSRPACTHSRLSKPPQPLRKPLASPQLASMSSGSGEEAQQAVVLKDRDILYRGRGIVLFRVLVRQCNPQRALQSSPEQSTALLLWCSMFQHVRWFERPLVCGATRSASRCSSCSALRASLWRPTPCFPG